jgi:HD-GYP domain-containing protein (c-di-GMP phosphodiesterase class II)
MILSIARTRRTDFAQPFRAGRLSEADCLLAIVDVWDALLSDRPYRAARPEDLVRERLRAQTGLHFDPMVTETFFRAIGR